MTSETLNRLGLPRNPAGASPLPETTRGAEAPQEVVACSVFIIGFGLFVFVKCPRHEVFFMTLPIGSQEQTDCFGRCVALILRSNQYRLCLKTVFCCSRPGRGASPKYNASPKESVSCASRRLVFIVRESIRLIFIVLCIACYCSCTKHIAGCVPTFTNPSKTRACLYWWGG